MRTLVDALLSHPAEVMLAITMLVGFIVGPGWLKAKASDARVRRILTMADVAFAAVEEMSAKGQLPADVSKSAQFLRELDRLLLAQGQPEASTDDQTIALTAAKALNAKWEAASADPR